MPDPATMGALIAASAAAFAAWASRNAAVKVAKQNNDTSEANARTAAETEAFNRARTIDDRTIKRLEDEIEDSRRENDNLRKRLGAVEEDNSELRLENSRLRRRVAALEAKQEEKNE